MKALLLIYLGLAMCALGQTRSFERRAELYADGTMQPHNDWTNGLRGLKGKSLVAFLKSGLHDRSYESDKADLFYAIQLMGTNASIYLDEMLELSRLDLPPTHRNVLNSLAVDTLIRIGPAVAVPVARSMSKDENYFWSGQEILLALNSDAQPAVAILHEMVENNTIPSGRSRIDVETLILILQSKR
jgi:hypothetical protein